MITAVTTCMGRLDHLKTTLPFMLSEFERVIVVDWSCPQNCGDWAENEGAEVVRRKGEKYFSAPKARNLGARHVQTRSVCFIDADVLPMTGCKAEIENLLNLSSMVIAARTSDGKDVHSLGGFIALDIGQFWGVAGYDESLTGYCLEDAHLRARLYFERDLKPKRLSAGALAALRHDNELRGKFFEEKITVSAQKALDKLNAYLKTKGVTDWFTDPRTQDINYRTFQP